MLRKLRRMLSEITKPVADELHMMEELISRESSWGLASADSVARHITHGGGKRMRPAIFLLASMLVANGDFEKRREELVRIAAALELTHAASLLHDDVIDEAAVRRGRPSANASFGNRTSVLVGDLLWCAASAIIVTTGMERLMTEFVGAAKSTTIGEIMEAGASPDLDAYIRVVEGKTASLFATAARSAAIVAGAGAAVETSLGEYGRSLGIAFQITDDAMDGDVNVLGGPDAARALAREYADSAKLSLRAMASAPHADSLMKLADYAADRTS